MNPATLTALLDVIHVTSVLIQQHQRAGTEPTLAELSAVTDKLYDSIKAHTEAMRQKLAAQVGG